MTELKHASLWTDTSAEAKSRYSVLANEKQVDVAVVGGGITGLSTALHLAELGCSVCVLEAGSIPTGGSTYSVGLVNAGLWIAPDDIVAALGPETGERVNRLLGEAPAKVFELIDRFDIKADDERAGTLHLAHNRKGADELARRAEQFQKRGAPVELLDDAAAKQRAGLDNIQAALLDRRAGTVNPAAYTRGLAKAAASLGAKIHTDTKVLSVIRKNGQWIVSTGNGNVTAEHVVLATNAYTKDQWNAVYPTFFPGCFYQVASKPLQGEVADRILAEGQGSWDTRTVLSSIRRDVHGRLILGSLGNAERRSDCHLCVWANRIREHYMPELGPVEWEYVWTGTISFTPDHTVRLFRPAENMLAVSGYNGRGITTGTVVGKGFADTIVKGDESGLPLPIESAEPVSLRGARSCAYESGFALYHTAQVMRVLI